MSPKSGMLIGVGASIALVGAAVGIVLWARNEANSIGRPSATLEPGMLDVIPLLLDYTTITTPAPSGTGAAELYLDALKSAKAIPEFVQRITQAAEPEKIPELQPILEILLRAADQGLPREASLDFDGVLRMSPLTDWYMKELLVGVGRVAAKASMSYRSDGRAAESDRALRAALIFGDRLYHQGQYVSYKSAGLSLISSSLIEFRSTFTDFTKDPAKATAAKTLYDQYLPVSRTWARKEQIVRVVKPNNGDLWNLAQHDADRAWRIEGIMWLGVGQWTSAAGGRQEAVRHALEQTQNDADPTLAQHAKAALVFTKENVENLPAHPDKEPQ